MTARQYLGCVSPRLEALLQACLDARANAVPLPEAVYAAAIEAERVMDAADLEAAQGFYDPPQHGWTCFHCGETFHTAGTARDHFGADQFKDAACKIKVGKERGLVMALRRAEEELELYRNEDSDKDREMHRMLSEHSEALRREEEKGYARGLRDGQYAILAENEELVAAADEAIVAALNDDTRWMLSQEAYAENSAGRRVLRALRERLTPLTEPATLLPACVVLAPEERVEILAALTEPSVAYWEVPGE